MNRLRVEKMERQLANLTGLVQKALQAPGPSPAPAAAPRQDFPAFPARPSPAGLYHSTQLKADTKQLSFLHYTCVDSK